MNNISIKIKSMSKETKIVMIPLLDNMMALIQQLYSKIGWEEGWDLLNYVNNTLRLGVLKMIFLKKWVRGSEEL